MSGKEIILTAPRFDGFGLTDGENSGIVGTIWHQNVPKGAKEMIKKQLQRLLSCLALCAVLAGALATGGIYIINKGK